MFIFLDFYFDIARAIKKEGGENFKKFAVFMYCKLESKYKTSSTFDEVMVQNQKKNVFLYCFVANL
jgi:hypothetical protein